MSKRKRKRNRPTGSSRRRAPSQPESHAVPASAAAPRRSQRGLLVIAVLLLSFAGAMNLQRLRKNRLAAPLPYPAQAVVATKLAPAISAGPDAKRFTALTVEESGIDFQHPVLPDHPMAYLYFSSPASGGTAIGDVNDDGRPDIFIASGPLANRLYLQEESPLRFRDATQMAGVGDEDVWSCGATMVDINGDGRLDIFVANYDAPNQLFLNLGNGRFVDRAPEYGLNLTEASLEGAFADYDRDGDLDLYLLTYRFENPAGMPAAPPWSMKDGKRQIRPDMAKYYSPADDELGYGPIGRWDNLLRNNGDGSFTNVTIEAGIYGPGHGQSVTWWDYDQDGFVDLHVGNDFNDLDRLYRNQGDGTFKDVAADVLPHTSWFSMGADFADLDGDGWPDLLSADMSSTTHFKQKTTMGSMGNAAAVATLRPHQYMRNTLLLNAGVGRFKEAAYLAGLESTDWTWAVKLVDFDCDGWNDAFFTNGSVRSFTDSDLPGRLKPGQTEWDRCKNTQPFREPNLVFQNRGNLQFKDQSKSWGLDHLGVSMSAAHGDLDGDGDLDLVVAHMDEPMTIYRNDSVEGTRMTMRLHGRAQNRFATGAQVEVRWDERRQVAQLQPTRGFLASNQPVLHFGCGEAETVDLVIRWPDGAVQTLDSVRTDFHYDITQPDGSQTSRNLKGTATPEKYFSTRELVPAIAHVENRFDDFREQPLLPHRMSALGPALAAADVNGDGAMDLFMGGAAGAAGRVAIWDPQKNTYQLTQQPALSADQQAEDMGALWLDADADGDSDLLVANGGNDTANPDFQPRLYWNDGMGDLSRSVDWIPECSVSAGPLAAADFDADGDIDVFLGGRQVPGKYPLPTTSMLLVNEGTRFVDGTESAFPTGMLDGMVTGAVWSDVDNDGDLDLLVTYEWDSIRLFQNQNGTFRDASAEAGLTAYRGWWTGISPADFDGDGDMDYIATNLGTNTKYHASDDKPFRIFFGDFEGNGTPRLVEAEYEADQLFPVRGKSCSTHAMPSLGDKFKTYKGFAAATLEEIYTPQRLTESYQCSANYLPSAILINDGQGRFQLRPLPNDAQLSPCFGTVVFDFDMDGRQDVLLAQNFFSPQVETGNFDGGLGCLLLGNGDGTFSAVSTHISGIVLPQDATSIVLQYRETSVDAVIATNNGRIQHLSGNLHSDEKPAALVEPKVDDAGSQGGKCLRVIVEDVTSSAELAGVRLEVDWPDGSQYRHEITAGAGYLSQQPPIFQVAVPGHDGGVLRMRKHGQTIYSGKIGPGQTRVRIRLSTD